MTDTAIAGTLSSTSQRVHATWTKRPHHTDPLAWNDARDIALVFVGDDFDVATRSSATSPATSTPARALLALYESAGPDFVRQLNGRFTGLIVDERRRQVILFNDRYGANRLYVHRAAEGVYFSSKAGSLAAVHPALAAVDPRGLAEFYSVGCVLQNRSLYKGVELLPPAARWTFEAGVLADCSRYFDPSEWEQQQPLAPDDYQAELQRVFARVMPKYLRAPAKVAMSLTGGLDSRMILAWAGAPAGTLPCYTFGGPYRDCADVTLARRLAAIAHQPHTTIRIGNDFFRDFDALARTTIAASDGAMDVSGAVEIYVNRLAREIAPIRLTGNYGSEILRSNVAFRPARLDLGLFTPEFAERLREAADTYRLEASGHRLSFIAFKQVPWHHYARFAAEQSQLDPRSPFLDNELVALAYRCPPHLATSPDPVLQLIAAGNPELDRIGTDRALRARRRPLLGGLAHRWQEFTAKAEYAYDYGMPPWLSRIDSKLRAFHLERLFLGRHKFYHYRVWYRDGLRQSVQARPGVAEHLTCYRPKVPGTLVEDHLTGRLNRTVELHKLLTLQLLAEEGHRACHN